MTRSDNATPYKASDYDQHVGQVMPFYDLMHQQAIDLVKTVNPDAKCWLDAGCGTGRFVELALLAFPNARFILSDSSEAMLQEAKKRLTDQPEHRVEFLPAVRNEDLGLFTNRLATDVITSILCNHYLKPQQRQEAVLACHQTLQPGGILITFENIDTRTAGGARIGLERWKRHQLEQGRPLQAVEDHMMRFKAEYFPITIEEHLELLEAVGFRVAEVFWLSHMQAGLYAIK
jgi:tRNA (cmo5U34)-methyltransferase